MILSTRWYVPDYKIEEEWTIITMIIIILIVIKGYFFRFYGIFKFGKDLNVQLVQKKLFG